MMFGTGRRMRITVLSALVLTVVGFVYVDAVPLRKSLRQAQKPPDNQQQFDQGVNQNGQNAIPVNNAMPGGNAPQVPFGVNNNANVQQAPFRGAPINDGQQGQFAAPPGPILQRDPLRPVPNGNGQQVMVGAAPDNNRQQVPLQGVPNSNGQQPPLGLAPSNGQFDVVQNSFRQQQQQPFVAAPNNNGQQLPLVGQQLQLGGIPSNNQQQHAPLGVAQNNRQQLPVPANQNQQLPSNSLQQQQQQPFLAPNNNPSQNNLPQGDAPPAGGLGGPVGGLGAPNPNHGSLQMVGGVQQLGGVQNPAQVQQPVSDGQKPDNVVVQQGQAPDMPAGGAPDNLKADIKAPPPAESDSANQQVPQPEPFANNIPLAKVPQHREQQIEQPHVENDDDKHPIKKAVFLDSHKALKVNDLKPPDHLDAVRLEQDGHLNRDYKKEIFLGNHEEIEQGTEQEIKNKLKDIFHRVDTNTDGFISAAELESWIIQKVEEHFDEAVKENEHVFRALDTDQDGDITWREFHIQFLMAKGFEQEKAERHMEDYETIPLEADDKEQLIRFKFRWAEADEDPQDNKLTMVEFRNFRHPEQSENMLMRMVMDIIENLDKDHDGIITQEEFAALPPGEVDEQWKESDRMWQEERRKEFKDVMDYNQDGKVTKEELKRYVDPKNPQHSRLESQNLIELSDTNKDGKLSLDEMLENTELFLGSKVVNTGRSFHDEF